MDPDTGRLYESPEAARAAGVEDPVEILDPDDLDPDPEVLRRERIAKKRARLAKEQEAKHGRHAHTPYEGGPPDTVTR